jgi:hypothetical protein
VATDDYADDRQRREASATLDSLRNTVSGGRGRAGQK